MLYDLLRRHNVTQFAYVPDAGHRILRGTFIRVSPSSKTILGYDASELIGRSARGILYPPDLDNTREEMRRARRHGEMRYFECRYVHRDGHLVPLAWTGVWSKAEQQHFFIGRDNTERQEVEARLADRPVDLLLSDIVMPGGVSGFELARTAIARWPALKVLLSSGFPEAKMQGNGETIAGVRLLSKPYRREDLARALRESLEAPSPS
ncbi:MAG TPA: PAS domain S-box protein [Stellaceae bacterium]|nr:PAS domain S-box protein [Stellaceae bacterium]